LAVGGLEVEELEDAGGEVLGWRLKFLKFRDSGLEVNDLEIFELKDLR
jgi:hypothetical protein